MFQAKQKFLRFFVNKLFFSKSLKVLLCTPWLSRQTRTVNTSKVRTEEKNQLNIWKAMCTESGNPGACTFE